MGVLHHDQNNSVFTDDHNCSWKNFDKVAVFSLFKICVIVTHISLICIFEFTANGIADNSKIWFRNYCNLLLQHFTLLLKNTLKEFVWRGINLFTLHTALHHCYCKSYYVYLKCLQVCLTVFLFVFEMSIYFIFSTNLQGLQLFYEIKLNLTKKSFLYRTIRCCCFKFINIIFYVGIL